jgi:hypothetical protein
LLCCRLDALERNLIAAAVSAMVHMLHASILLVLHQQGSMPSSA